MIYRLNPQTIYAEEFIESPEKYIFEKNKKSIAVGL